MNLKNIDNKIYSDKKENQELISLFNSGKLQAAKKKAIQLLIKNPKAYVIHNIFGAILVSENNLDEAIIHQKNQ